MSVQSLIVIGLHIDKALGNWKSDDNNNNNKNNVHSAWGPFPSAKRHRVYVIDSVVSGDIVGVVCMPMSSKFLTENNGETRKFS